MTSNQSDLRAMLASAKKHPMVRQFMGAALHPGGVAMTLRLSQLAQAAAGTRKRTLVSGLGQVDGALYLAKTSGLTVVSLLEDPGGLQAATDAAAKAGVGRLVTFTATQPKLDTFDSIIAEGVAVLATDPAEVPGRLAAMVNPGGVLAMSEVVAADSLPQEIYDILAGIGWSFQPRSLQDMVLALEAAGLTVTHQEELRDLLPGVLKELVGKLGAAEMGAKFGAVPVEVAVIQRIKTLTERALTYAQHGRLGYAIAAATKKSPPL